MTLKTARLVLDRSLLPQKSANLGIKFERHSVTKIKPGSPPADMVLIKPAGGLLTEESVGPEPRWNCILCGIALKTRDGTKIRGEGQLVITGQRFLGMIGGAGLDDKQSTNILGFTFLRDDVYDPQIKKHRLTPSDFLFRSKEEQFIAFQLQIFAAVAYVANGKMGYWYDKNMLYTLSDVGREGLLKS